jgi:hypothetical protein
LGSDDVVTDRAGSTVTGKVVDAVAFVVASVTVVITEYLPAALAVRKALLLSTPPVVMVTPGGAPLTLQE